MKIKLSFFTARILLIILFLSFSHTAAQQEAEGLKKLAGESDLIIVGKVKNLNPHWNENKSRIFTRVSLEVSENLKGNAGNKIYLDNPGGEVDGVGEIYSHTAKFNQDEEVILFLRKNKQGNLFVNNGPEGKYIVTVNNAETENIINRSKLKNFKEQIKNYIKE
jgi:hypothetical protein